MLLAVATLAIFPVQVWAQDPGLPAPVDAGALGAADVPADVQAVPDEMTVNSPEDTADLDMVSPSGGARIEQDPDATAIVDALQSVSIPLHQSAKDSAKIGGVMFVAGLGGIAAGQVPVIGAPLLVGGATSAILGAGTLIGAGLEEVAVFGLDLTSAVISVYSD